MVNINEQIAIEIMGYEQGNFKCVDGKKFILRDLIGNLYFENDSCLPDYYNNDSLSIEILSCFNNWELKRFIDSHYVISIRQNGKLFEIFGNKLSETVCKCALLAKRFG